MPTSNAQLSSDFFSVIKGFDALQKKGVDKNAQLSGLKIVNDKEFTVELNAPSSTFETRLAYVFTRRLTTSFFKNPKAGGQKPVGDGAYNFDSLNHNQSIKLVKNKNYKGILPAKNASVTFKVYTDPQAAYSDVQAGNLDAIDTIPTSRRRPSATIRRSTRTTRAARSPSRCRFFPTNRIGMSTPRKACSVARPFPWRSIASRSSTRCSMVSTLLPITLLRQFRATARPQGC